MRTEDKVRAFIEEQNMVEKGTHVLIGLSGGADSVCLFHLLLELQEEYAMTLTAVHVEHGIRGEVALEDARFVERLCLRYKVPLYVEHYAVPDLAKKEGMSEEEMGRKLRYSVFEQIAEKVGATRIATAHHENDVAETILFNLCRGTGVAGLCALQPVRGRLIRPLLCLSRDEIEAYLAEKQIEYREDYTNQEIQYSRNYIRKEIIPRLMQVNARAVQHISSTSQVLAQANKVLEKEIVKAVDRYVDKDASGMLIANELWEQEAEYVISGVVQWVVSELAGSRKDIQGVHVQGVLGLHSLQVGKRVDLPYDMQASREYLGILLKRQDTVTKSTDGMKPVNLMIPGITTLPDGSVVEARVFFANELEKIPNKTYTKWFDYDIINKSLQVRNRYPKDYMVVDEQGRRKKIKELFINEKVPRLERDDVLLIADGQLVLWAVGVRMGEYGKISPKTQQVVEINIRGGKNHE